MCSECLQNPCHPRCPNAESPEVYAKCYICGYEIYEGEKYFEMQCGDICTECLKDFSKIAGED
jgi:hypothetical protein